MRSKLAAFSTFCSMMAVTAVGSAHAASPASEFSTTYQINPAHSGTIQFSSVFKPPLKKAWSVTFAGGVSYPIVADGKVFVSVADSPSGTPLLVALDLKSGKVAWQKATAVGTLAYDGGRLFFTDFSGPLQAFDAITGNPLWSTQLPGQYYFNFVPIAVSGHVYTGGDESGTTLYQVDEATGNLGWTQLLSGGGAGPTFSAGKVLFAVPCDVPAWVASTGKLLWNYSTGCDGGGGSIAAVYGGRVYAPGVNITSGVVLNAATGAVIGNLSGGLPAFNGNISYSTGSTGITASNTVSGNLVWEFGTKDTLVGSPIVVNGTVFVASATGAVYALNGRDGKLLQTLQPGLGGGQQSSEMTGLAAGQGVLVVPTGNVLSAYRP